MDKDKDALELTARLVALEFLVENAYAVALMQTRNPAGEARELGAICADLARRLEAGGKGSDPVIASALAAGVARALDSIFGRIRARLEKRAEDYPTAGRA